MRDGIVVRGSVAIAAALAGAAAATLCAAGIAAAASPPDVVGKDYSDASGTLSDAGFTPVVSTTFGDRKARSDCVVVNEVARTVPPPENSGGSATSEVLVSLNCEAGVASATQPGNSLASPEGRKAAEEAAEKAREAQEQQQQEQQAAQPAA